MFTGPSSFFGRETSPESAGPYTAEGGGRMKLLERRRWTYLMVSSRFQLRTGRHDEGETPFTNREA